MVSIQFTEHGTIGVHTDHRDFYLIRCQASVTVQSVQKLVWWSCRAAKVSKYLQLPIK